MKSLGTGYRADAVRKARIVAAAFEQQWRDIEAHGVRPVIAVPSERSKPEPPPPVSPADKTLRQAFELFRSDPAKQRTRKTDLHYLNLIELTVGLWGEHRTIRSIDREASRELLDVLLWLPSNAQKKFPKLSPLAAARMATPPPMIHAGLPRRTTRATKEISTMDETVDHDESGSSEDRRTQNHGNRENLSVTPAGVPSAPPGVG